METSEIVALTSIFPFHASHIRLDRNLIACGNQAWIDRIAITDPKVTSPKGDRFPQRAKLTSVAGQSDECRLRERLEVLVCPWGL
jgi:hypothetical protein